MPDITEGAELCRDAVRTLRRSETLSNDGFSVTDSSQPRASDTSVAMGPLRRRVTYTPRHRRITGANFPTDSKIASSTNVQPTTASRIACSH